VTPTPTRQKLTVRESAPASLHGRRIGRPAWIIVALLSVAGQPLGAQTAKRGGTRATSARPAVQQAAETAMAREAVVAPLTPTDAIAVAVREYRAGGRARVVTVGNAVLYPFGHGQAALACTVLRVCVVELEQGETIIDAPLAGDQARWIVQTARTGPGGTTPLVVVKPTQCDITTNLVVPTDRRIYDVLLASPPCGARGTVAAGRLTARHARFYYPDDLPGDLWPGVDEADGPRAEVATWQTASYRAGGGSPELRLVGAGAFARRGVAVRTFNRDYRVKRERRGPFGLFGTKRLDFPWVPEAIADDGRHVYVALPMEARAHAAPVLYALEDDGSRTMINYSVRNDPRGGDTFVTDRVFRRGLFVLGAGGRVQQLEFENRAWGRSTEPQAPDDGAERGGQP
jgi:type IV secretory pathway VirB9-like protein